jgi:hypothetical protein
MPAFVLLVDAVQAQFLVIDSHQRSLFFICTILFVPAAVNILANKRAFAKKKRFYNPKKGLTQRRKERRGKTETLKKNLQLRLYFPRLRVSALMNCIN